MGKFDSRRSLKMRRRRRQHQKKDSAERRAEATREARAGKSDS